MLGSLVGSLSVEMLVGSSLVGIPVDVLVKRVLRELVLGVLEEGPLGLGLLVGSSLVGVPVLVDLLVKGVLAAGLSAKQINTSEDMIQSQSDCRYIGTDNAVYLLLVGYLLISSEE